MSLIDEALKRAELEAARRDGLRGGTYPWVMEGQPTKRRRWALVAAALAVVAAAAGGWLWLQRGAVQSPRSGARGQVSRVPSPVMETVEVPTPVVGLPSRSIARTESKPEATAARESKRRPPAANEAAREERAAAVSTSSRNPAEDQPGIKVVDGRTYAGEVKVPDGGKIALEGIVYSESNPVALINGHVMPPGAVVEEFTIVSIKPDRVELKGRGITIFLALK